jgi:heme exporter protein C
MSQKAITSTPVMARATARARGRALSRNDRILAGLTALSALMMLAALWLVFLYAPEERTMGQVQRIFYFHVPSALIGFLAFFVTLVASALYLARRDPRADMLAVSSAEIGLVLLTMNIVSGSIWARPIWNAWWTWDPRLTTATICWLAYVAYFMLRGALDDPERAQRLSAVYGIVAFVTVPITYLSISLLRTIHPNLLGSQASAKGDAPLTAEMRAVFSYCIVAFSVLYVTLLWHRLRLERLRRNVEALKARLLPS